jgi:hypothetical protein
MTLAAKKRKKTAVRLNPGAIQIFRPANRGHVAAAGDGRAPPLLDKGVSDDDGSQIGKG